jgi:SAM-dependent methyltransferase
MRLRDREFKQGRPSVKNMHANNTFSCPLCFSPGCGSSLKDLFRTYHRCPLCGLVFVPPEFHVSAEEEKLRYSKHTNTLENSAYVAYLSAVAHQALSLPALSPSVLDFGSGPQQVLADILAKRGVKCVSHDPLYGITAKDSDGQYDIIVACEVFEHLRDLNGELAFITQRVKPGGYLYVHTQMYDTIKDFASWWYLKDVTHINFFCETTMRMVAKKLGMALLSTNKKDTAVFTKIEEK